LGSNRTAYYQGGVTDALLANLMTTLIATTFARLVAVKRGRRAAGGRVVRLVPPRRPETAGRAV
jgi:hypothetical protein